MVSASNDLTCDFLIRKYPHVSFFRFNVDLFSSYNVAVTRDGFHIENKYESISFMDCRSIYYRKPVFENLEGILEPLYHSFAHKEVMAFVEGIIESFAGRCLSKPSIMRRANNKIVQLKLANELGFKIPDSLITNSSFLVIDKQPRQQIVKPLSTGTIINGDQKEFVQTNMVDSSVSMSELKFAPSYFQEYVEKDYELRITIVAGKAFAVRIDSDNKIDWRRPGNKINYSIVDTPDFLYNQCMAFMSYLKMEFGCFDFIFNEGDYHFLEMNANGQWAWLEMEVGVEISNAIVEYLSGD